MALLKRDSEKQLKASVKEVAKPKAVTPKPKKASKKKAKPEE